jgi:tRNA threonylcarbamoyladenosine biosynthesis protein TsaB
MAFSSQRVLALDTTTRAGSTALIVNNHIVDERGGDAARTHALRLPDEILTLVSANQCALSDIDLYAVATGPGSFTGLRIGIATIQGLAHVHNRRVVGIPALEALAHAASRDLPADALVAAWMDAHRHDVFAALYRVGAAASFSRPRLVEIEGPSVGSAASTLARWRALGIGLPALFVGDGAVLYADEIAREAFGGRVAAPPLLAGAIGLLASDRAAEAVEPSALRPLYVRRADVEISRDEKLRQTNGTRQGL